MDEEQIKEILYPVNIENELTNAKKECNRLLSILSRCVCNKYNLQGYSTDYILGNDIVSVIFQEIGRFPLKKYNIKFDEIKDLDAKGE